MSLRPGAVDFDEKWRDLRQTIDSVVHLRSVKRVRWNDNISDIYALCVALPKSFAETLYGQTKSLLEDSVSLLAEQLLLLETRELMFRYHHHWMLYRQGARYLDNLFSYFNRVHLNKYRPQESLDYQIPGISLPPLTITDPNAPVEIRNMALLVWKEKMLQSISRRLVQALLGEVRRDHLRLESSLHVVKDVVDSFIEVAEYSKDHELEYYQEVFEGPFLSDMGELYKQLAAQFVAELSYSDYLAKAVALLESARVRGEKFLHASSMIKFVRECEARLVTDQTLYLHSYVSEVVHAEQLKDLANLFILFSGIPRNLQPIITQFTQRVKHQGLSALKSLLSSKNTPEVHEFVNVVLSTHRKYSDIVRSVFAGHKAFMNALDVGCRGFVNFAEGLTSHTQAPRLLAKYCDMLLRKGFKGSSESELEEKLDEAIIVFTYIEDKDTFQKFYSRSLARRFVFNNYLSMEAEESMVQKLKHVCGYEYTSRLQRMIVDINLSDSLMTEFHASNSEALPISFSALVLQSGAWQLSQLPCPITVIPEELIFSMNQFEQFYRSKHYGRCLSWLHHLSFGELKLGYLKKPYLVTMTTLQMIVMMAFETEDQHSISSLQRATQLDRKELQTTVQSLVDVKLLTETEVAGDPSASSTPVAMVTLNLLYSNRRTKFKVSSVLQRETQQDVEQTHQMVLEDRKMFLQAAIVRVMKARKTLKYNQLIQETILQMKHRFNPSISLIKKCIETLMDKQYIERDSESMDTYNYIA